MNRLAAHLYQREIRRYNFKNTAEWLAGIISTVHKCGNGLNYNPHVHMIATRELVDVNTGELLLSRYVSYKKFRFLWQDFLLRYLVRKKLLTTDESAQFRRLYRNGFHVYFQPISGTQTDILFRTAEYLASGYFHNSQILKVDNEGRKIREFFASVFCIHCRIFSV